MWFGKQSSRPVCKVSQTRANYRRLGNSKELPRIPSIPLQTFVQHKSKETKTPVSMPCCALICREAMRKRHLVNAVAALVAKKSRKSKEVSKELHPVLSRRLSLFSKVSLVVVGFVSPEQTVPEGHRFTLKRRHTSQNRFDFELNFDSRALEDVRSPSPVSNSLKHPW